MSKSFKAFIRKFTAPASPPPAENAPPADLLRLGQTDDAEAQNALGLWYAANLPETRQAEKWFKRAADQGFARAQHNMGVVAMRSAQTRLAVEWFGKAVSGGWTPSNFALGALLEEEGNVPGALELYQSGARQGCANSQDALGRLAFDEEAEASYETARYWSEKAAEQGHAAAQARLGTIHHEGLGVDRNPEQAVSWFLKAAQRGHSGAQFMIGVAHHMGIGIKVNRVAAARFLSLSRHQGNKLAGVYLATVEADLTPEEKLRLQRE